MGKSIHNDILNFIQSLPYWQKYLSAFLITTLPDSSEEDVIKKAAQYFLSENDLLKEPLQQVKLVISKVTDSNQNASSKKGKLISISNLKNIAAVREKQTLPISKSGITAIFGVTGVGKSSYSRVMNHAFISRGDVNVIGNAFDSNRPGSPEAVFTFKNDNGEEYNLNYPSQIDSKEFQQYATFDSAAVKVHINSNNELHVTPRELDFFENLVNLVSKTTEHIQTLINETQKENVFPRHFSEDSDIKTLMSELGASSRIEAIRKLGNFTEEDVNLLKGAEKKSAELKINDLISKKNLNQTISNEICDLKIKLEKMAVTFSKENLKEAQRQIECRATLFLELKKLGIKTFNDPKFKGITSDAWKTFISSGKEFSDLQENSLSEGEPCPYCRQDLTLIASKLIKNYEIYLKSEAENKFKECDNYISKAVREFQSLVLFDSNSKPDAMKWLCEKKTTVSSAIQEALAYYSQLRNNLIKNLEEKNWTELNLKVFKVDWLALDRILEEERKLLNSNEIENKKKELDTQIIYLKHKKTLKCLLPQIEIFMSNMKWANECEQAKKNIHTNAITNASKKLYKNHITELYQKTFKEECLELNVRSLELKQVGKSGITKRHYVAGDTKPSNVLSEGEQRAFALADFFTEVKISKIDGGWIFDDPVASQDHERKERIAQKLAKEARSRQIIIFTHDLVFLSDLVNAATENDISITHHLISNHSINDAGIITANCKKNFEEDYIQPTFAKEFLNKANDTENPIDKNRLLKDGFDALRTSYEAFFTLKILRSVITRFDRRIKYAEISEIYIPKNYLCKISKKLAYLSRNISAHLQPDNEAFAITHDILKKEIHEYKETYDQYVNESRKNKNSKIKK